MSGDLHEQLIADGNVLPPERPTGALYDKMPEPLDLGFSASEELDRQRAERL